MEQHSEAKMVFTEVLLIFSLMSTRAHLLFSPWGKRWTNVFKRGR